MKNIQYMHILTPVSSLTSLTAPVKISSDWYQRKDQIIPKQNIETYMTVFKVQSWIKYLKDKPSWYFPKTNACGSTVFLLYDKNLRSVICS